jgi:myosin heavy subunit
MDSWPNQEALNKALNIYRASMRSFIIFRLKQIRGETVEDIVLDSLESAKQFERATEIDRILIQSNRNIESLIDINDFPHLVNKNWVDAFESTLNDDKTFRNQLWLIVECRNADWAHPPEGDAEVESTRAHLFLIADVLGKINKSDAKDRVEVIRDELDDAAERLADAEERLKEMEAENAVYKENLAEVEKHLETAKSEKSKYEETNATLSQQIDEKEKRHKKLSRQLKNARAETDKNKKNLADTKKRLEKSEAAQANYKERLRNQSKELKDTKNELTSMRVERNAFEKYLTGTQNPLTTVAIDNQTVFPSLGTDAAVRIIDRRGTDKRNYLLALLEQKQPTIVYVQSETMVDRLVTRVVPEEEYVIGRCYQQTSEAEETEILEKLENGELIAAVSSTTLSTLTPAHPIEHFIFCHLVPGLEEFFKRCQPAFTSKKNTYLHLIYNNEQDIEGLNEWLTQNYPNRETLEKLYPELKQLAAINGDFIDIRSLYSELDIAKLGIETGLAIFEELQLLERNGESIKLLTPAGKTLDESETYCKGEKLKKETTDFCPFQLEHSIEQIWEKMLEELNIES